MPEHTESGRVELRIKPEDKAVLARAAALERQDLTSFILGSALPRARRDQRSRIAAFVRARFPARARPAGTPARTARASRSRRQGRLCPGVIAWGEASLARHHDRVRFDSEDDDLNTYLKRHARQNHDSGGAKCFVAVPLETPLSVVLPFAVVAKAMHRA